MTGPRRTPAPCGTRWAHNTCQLPARHQGPHACTYLDHNGHERRRTWLSRWSAA